MDPLGEPGDIVVRLTLHVWRQAGRDAEGQFVTYEAREVSPDMSFLEMLDVVNEEIQQGGGTPIAFDHDCREGICGSCSLMINGVAHGPQRATATCQLHMRTFKDDDVIYIEPWRARAFPVLKDLVVDRGALDRIVAAGGYISVRTGGTPDGNAIPIPKPDVDGAMDAAACIGCGACVAACPNGSASLFTAAKITHLGLLPQGQPERYRRVRRMVAQMDAEGFGGCTFHAECQEACPKEISIATISRMNRDFFRATLSGSEGGERPERE
jgi:succinate dehydrogenase / fumarate reductase, iron-sulfur subunit